jgi:hypothetical protein
VTDAMPFFARARQVLVLEIENWGVAGPTGRELADALKRHGLPVQLQTVAAGPRGGGFRTSTRAYAREVCISVSAFAALAASQAHLGRSRGSHREHGTLWPCGKDPENLVVVALSPDRAIGESLRRLDPRTNRFIEVRRSAVAGLAEPPPLPVPPEPERHHR